MMQQTIEKLRSLKLNGFLEAIAEQTESSLYRDLSFEERLSMLVEREYLKRENSRLKRRITQARLNQQASIDTIDFDLPRQGLAKSKLAELAQVSWIHEHLDLIIIGPTGIGKTFLACALAQQACKLGLNSLYIKAHELLSELLIAEADGSTKQYHKKLNRFPLLVIDEWLREPLAPHQARQIQDLIDERYRKASCLFLSQLPVPDWHQHISEPTAADAILDRIVHDSIRINLKGESIRKHTSKLADKQANSAS